MSIPSLRISHRQRELRRRVLLPARLRAGAQWSDARILNISSRGLMIQSARPMAEGSVIELRRGDHVIVAQVMWRCGAKAGLQSQDLLPVEQIMSLSQCKALKLVASEGRMIERRSLPRTAPDWRMRGRAVEFLGMLAILFGLATGAWAVASRALAAPLARTEAALSR